jgi:O-antigen ligase
MFFARPLTGFGARHLRGRVHAELPRGGTRWGVDLSNPGFIGSYADAHNDILQAFAEFGIPAATLIGILVVCAFRRSKDPLLVVGLVAALAWFPLQRPVTAMVLLAAIGAALVSTEDKRSMGATIFAGLAIVFATFEVPRYVSRTYPGDWRPLHDAASARFRRGEYARAAELFERANALGERPEIDMNLALALDHLGDHERAARLRARAVRVAPALSAKPLPAPSPSPSSRRDTSR